jgi:hypothetical protein
MRPQLGPACVPAYDTKRQIRPDAPLAVGADVSAPHIYDSHPEPGRPDVRGPQDVWHDEAYLIGWLVKCHGWRVVEPGLIRRSWRPEASVTALPNRAAARASLAQRREVA